MTGMSIYDRLDAAYKIVASKGFSKSGEVKGSARYNFIPITQILDAVREAHATCGVKVLYGRPLYDAECGEKRWSESRKTRNPASGEMYETRWQCAVGHMDVLIIGGGPDDVIETTIGFEAQDNSDKLTNKIYTNAERSLYRTLYGIDEGEGSDPEALNIEAVMDVQPAKPRPKADLGIPQDVYMDGAEIMARRQMAKDAVDIDEAKRVLMQVYRKDPQSLDRYVQMEDGRQPPAWSDDHIRSAYIDYMEGSD